MPGGAWRQDEVEQDQRADVYGCGCGRVERDVQPAPEARALVVQLNGAAAGEALSRQARREGLIVDLEDVGKVAVEVEGQACMHRRASERLQLQLVVERAAVEAPPQRERQRPCGELAG